MIGLFLSTVAWAEEHGTEAAHGHHGALEIPWHTIFVQGFNFLFLLALLTYLLRKPIAAHFANRSQAYKDLVDKAESARRDAERSHLEVRNRLDKLEASAQTTLQRAKTEADEMRTRLMREAKVLTEKMEQETQRSVLFELERAKAELRKELLEQSLASSRETMRWNLGTTEQKRLQNEFAEKIEVVDQ